MPPLVVDVRRQLAAADLAMTQVTRTVDLDLLETAGLEKSRLLHRLRLLAIVGYARTDGADFVGRDDLTRLWESWTIRWSP